MAEITIPSGRNRTVELCLPERDRRSRATVPPEARPLRGAACVPAAVAPSVRRKAPRHGPAFPVGFRRDATSTQAEGRGPRVEGRRRCDGSFAGLMLMPAASGSSGRSPSKCSSVRHRGGRIRVPRWRYAGLILGRGRHCCVSCVIQLHSRGSSLTSWRDRGLHRSLQRRVARSNPAESPHHCSPLGQVVCQ